MELHTHTCSWAWCPHQYSFYFLLMHLEHVCLSCSLSFFFFFFFFLFLLFLLLAHPSRSACCMINKLKPLWFWSMGLVCLGALSVCHPALLGAFCFFVFFGGTLIFKLPATTSLRTKKNLPPALPPFFLSFTWTKISCLPPLCQQLELHTQVQPHSDTHTHMRAHTLYFRSLIRPWHPAFWD